MNKAELRKYIRRLKVQNQATAAADSERIMRVLASDDYFVRAKTVLLYHSLPDEVSTHDFIEYWCQKKQVLLPVVVGDNLELRHYQGADELMVGAYGIAEPTGSLFTDYDQIEFVAVPGMAFDLHGNRLGRGKGYYDRLLPNLTNAYKVGICFPYQIVDEVPTEATDIPMDKVIKIE
ncbi:MAG: 5-formyltetrahydrofolate cyclo-ligase [Bacteroidaceae bacterium]|nr:5-formyltetrahydrofolate cyclo-ligase [Bacteroidaceae bacterium]